MPTYESSAAALESIIRCPACGGEIAELRCTRCDRAIPHDGGVLDLVENGGAERDFYDDFYAHGGHERGLEPYETVMEDPAWEDERIYAHLGDLTGRTVLVVGNGDSYREYHYLRRNPGMMIYSDISPVALRQIAASVPPDPRLRFAAVDATNIALADSSVDVIYGIAFVHHLEDIDRFLREAARVLRPGGRAIFLDDAHSPAWQALKLGPLRPLMRLGHRVEPRSEQDLEVTLAGGFREHDLAARIRAVGCEPWFERVAFAYYLWRRLTVSVFPATSRLLPRPVGRAARRLDEAVVRRPWGRRNMVRLIWGMTKPSANGGGAGYPTGASTLES